MPSPRSAGLSRLALLAFAAAFPLPPGAAVEETSQPVRLTRDGRRKEDLAWSPDGRRLACSYYHRPGRIGIGILDEPGVEFRVLTTVPVERAPSWSPDGRRLAFVHVTLSGTDGELDIHAMNADGSGRAPLIGGKAFDNFPAWSPDGSRLAFTTTRDKTQEIYLADGEGKNLRRLTSDSTLKQYPRWLPDGKTLLYASNPDGNFDLYLLPTEGGERRRLTDHPATDTCPAVSPDGKRVAWASLRDDDFEIYVMGLDGSGVRRVAPHPGYDYSPAWRDSKTLTWVTERFGRYEVVSVAL